MEQELGTVLLCGMRQVVRCQHWVVHESTEWVEQCRQLVVWIVSKCWVLNGLWRVKLAGFKCWPTLLHFFWRQHFVWNAKFVPQFALTKAVVTLGEEHQVTRLHVLGHAIWVFNSDEFAPVEPMLRVFPCHQNGVEVGIGKANNR